MCYVSDALDAPPAVMTHLCKERRINAVPIFRDGTLAEDVERRGVTKYFIGKNLHTVKNNSRVGMGMLVSCIYFDGSIKELKQYTDICCSISTIVNSMK